MVLWCQAIAQVVLHGPGQVRLGIFKADGHKLWEWQVVESRGRLYRQKGDHVEVYGHDQRGIYKHIRTSQSSRMRGNMATVEDGSMVTKKVCASASPPIRPIAPSDFLGVLKGCGQTWIWDNLKVSGGT